MQVPYHTLVPEASVWIYQADSFLNPLQKEIITQRTVSFLSRWSSHGAEIRAGFTLLYDCFWVLAADETLHSVSGCALDACVHFINETGELLRVDFLDKMQVAFRDSADTKIQILPLHDFKMHIQKNKLTENTIVFNNLVQTKAQMQTHWEVPAKESWHKKYFL